MKGHLCFTIEDIYTLQFTDAGELLKEEVQEAFAGDDHEELGFGDIPE